MINGRWSVIYLNALDDVRKATTWLMLGDRLSDFYLTKQLLVHQTIHDSACTQRCDFWFPAPFMQGGQWFLKSRMSLAVIMVFLFIWL